MAEKQFSGFSSSLRSGRLSWLLGSLLLLSLLYPFLAEHPLVRGLLEVLLLAVLLSTIHAASAKKTVVLIAGVLAVAFFAIRWTAYVIPNTVLLALSYGCAGLLLALTAMAILASVLQNGPVTVDTISGAVCVYLLFGLIWGFLFVLLELAHPGSFRIAEGMMGIDPPHAPPSLRFSLFLYFSQVTLATIGYGDITPVSEPARALAVLEATVGQLYLAVLVARLVGLHIAYTHRDLRGDPS
jgi:voltage-gated potassium channel